MPSTKKKAKATPNPSPCDLSTREVEIAVLAWKCLDANGKASTQTTPYTPARELTNNHTHSYTKVRSMEQREDHHNAPRKMKKATDNSLAPHPKQINNQKLAELTHIPIADSAARMWRGVKAKINAATAPSGLSDAGGPSTTPGVPATPDDGSVAAAVAAADPGSPLLIASMKKKNGAAAAAATPTAAGGKVAGRKRTMKEANVDDGGDTVDNKEAHEGKMPKAKRVKAERAVTAKEEPDPFVGNIEAGEV